MSGGGCPAVSGPTTSLSAGCTASCLARREERLTVFVRLRARLGQTGVATKGWGGVKYLVGRERREERERLVASFKFQ